MSAAREVTDADQWIGVVRLGRREMYVRRHRVAASAIIVALSIGTCAALGAAAGWRALRLDVGRLVWWCVPVVLAAHLVAYVAYAFAHHGLLNRSQSRPLSWEQSARVLAIGFGVWIIGGGFSVDRHALEWRGFTAAHARAAVVALSLLELALLSPAAWLCAVLLLGTAGISATTTWPWVVLVPAGFVLAVGLLVRGGRTDTTPEAGRLERIRCELLDGLRAALTIVRRPRRSVPIVAGIALYWAADIVALWAALHFVSAPAHFTRLVLAYATGYFLTRRSLPFGGVIVTEALMAFALVWVGVPLAGAVLAVLLFRLSDLVLTTGVALRSVAVVERTGMLSIEPARRDGGDGIEDF